jgi:hypothetical protein
VGWVLELGTEIGQYKHRQGLGKARRRKGEYCPGIAGAGAEGIFYEKIAKVSNKINNDLT